MAASRGHSIMTMIVRKFVAALHETVEQHRRLPTDIRWGNPDYWACHLDASCLGGCVWGNGYRDELSQLYWNDWAPDFWWHPCASDWRIRRGSTALKFDSGRVPRARRFLREASLEGFLEAWVGKPRGLYNQTIVKRFRGWSQPREVFHPHVLGRSSWIQWWRREGASSWKANNMDGRMKGRGLMKKVECQIRERDTNGASPLHHPLKQDALMPSQDGWYKHGQSNVSRYSMPTISKSNLRLYHITCHITSTSRSIPFALLPPLLRLEMKPPQYTSSRRSSFTESSVSGLFVNGGRVESIASQTWR